MLGYSCSMCLTHEMTWKLSIHAGIFLYGATATVAAVAVAVAIAAAAGAAEMQRKYEGG